MLDFGSNEDWLWDRDRGRAVVQFNVTDHESGQQFLCRISAECITEHCGNPTTDAARLDAAKAHFDQITDIARHLHTIGRFEPDGTILVRSSDWR